MFIKHYNVVISSFKDISKCLLMYSISQQFDTKYYYNYIIIHYCVYTAASTHGCPQEEL